MLEVGAGVAVDVGVGGAIVGDAVGSNWSGETIESGGGVCLAVVGSGNGVGEVFALVGGVPTATAVGITMSLESSGVASPEATSKPTVADSLRVQATSIRKRANGSMKIYSLVAMINHPQPKVIRPHPNAHKVNPP